jgi:hypothetical protein
LSPRSEVSRSKDTGGLEQAAASEERSLSHPIDNEIEGLADPREILGGLVNITSGRANAGNCAPMLLSTLWHE